MTQINVMSDAELLEQILYFLNEIRKQIKNKIFINQTATDLFYIYCNQLTDKGLAWIIKGRIYQFLKLEQEEGIINLTKEIEVIIKKAHEKILTLRPFIYPPPKTIIKTPNYIKDFGKFPSNQDQILQTEKDILTHPFQIKLHKPSKGKWVGHLHAHVTKNLLIVYLWDKDGSQLIWERIMKHTEFDGS